MWWVTAATNLVKLFLEITHVSCAQLLLETCEASALGSNDLFWLVVEEMLPSLRYEPHEEWFLVTLREGSQEWWPHEGEGRCPQGGSSFLSELLPRESRLMAVLLGELEGLPGTPDGQAPWGMELVKKGLLG